MSVLPHAFVVRGADGNLLESGIVSEEVMLWKYKSAVEEAPSEESRERIVELSAFVAEHSALGILELLLDTKLLHQIALTDGNITFFLPSTNGFLKTPRKMLQLFKRDLSLAKKILLSHMTEGSYPSDSLVNDTKIISYSAGVLLVNHYTTDDSNWKQVEVVTVNGVPIVRTDLHVPGVTVHIIEGILYPVTEGDIASVILADPRLTIFVKALELTGLDRLLEEEEGESFTIFAPTNVAFKNIPEYLLSETLRGNLTEFRRLLMRHILPGTIFSLGFRISQQVDSIGGEPLHVVRYRDQLKVQTAQVVEANIPAKNGAIHLVNTLI